MATSTTKTNRKRFPVKVIPKEEAQSLSSVHSAREKMLKRLRPGVSGLNEQITIDRREALASYRNIRQFRNYAAGRHDVTLTLDQQKMLEGVLGNEYCDNMCNLVIGEHADRLELKRVTTKQASTSATSRSKGKGQKEQEWIDTFWQKYKLDDLQQRVHRNTIRDGNYCLMIGYDRERKRIAVHREPWWDGDKGVFIGYDSYGEMLYAVKEWTTSAGRRRTVYYEGAIERYISTGGSAIWDSFALASDGQGTFNKNEPLPIPFVDEDGNPLHIPFLHYTNPSDEFENYGSSILDGGKVGAQDQINDCQYDISAAARMTGYQRTWSKGYKLQKINGKSVRPKTGPGTHYHADEPTADWGVLEAGSTTQLIEVYKMKVESFCRNTRTPHASITGNWPSGEALYRQEKPIYGATKARQKRMMPVWVEFIHRAMELANLNENAGLDEEILLTAEYNDAGDRDPLSVAMADLSMWQAADAAVQAGVPIETFLKVQGWGDDQITGLTTDIANMIKARQADLALTAPTTPGNGGGKNPNGSQPKPTPGGANITGGTKIKTRPNYKAAA